MKFDLLFERFISPARNEPPDIIDAQKHQVEVRPVDINHSTWDNLLEEKSGKYYVIRLDFDKLKVFVKTRCSFW